MVSAHPTVAPGPVALQPAAWAARAAAGLAALLFAYTLTRAVTLSMTFDEARSFMNLAGRYQPDPETSNTHYLNSLMMKLCSLIFGDAPLSLRLPNLVAHLLYLRWGWRALEGLQSRGFALAAFVLTQANPYVLDFFSIGRGYGLALAFTMGSLSHVTAGPADGRHTRWAVGLGIVAMLANLSFTTYLLALLGALTVRALADLHPRALRDVARAAWSVRGLALVALLAVAWAMLVGLDLQRRGELVWGGRRGFFRDTVVGLAAATLYGENPGAARALAWLVAAVVALGAVGLAWELRRSRTVGVRGTLLALGTLCVAGPVLQHALLGTYHLAERTALLFIPVLGLLAAYGWDAATARWRSARRPLALLAAGAAAVMLAHTGRAASFDRTYHFSFNDGVDEVPALIRAATRGAREPVEIGVQWTNGITLDYYVALTGMAWLHVNRVDKPFRYNLGVDRQFISDRPYTPFSALHYTHYRAGRFLLLQSPVAEAVLARHPRLIRLGYWPTSRLHLLRVPPRRPPPRRR